LVTPTLSKPANVSMAPGDAVEKYDDALNIRVAAVALFSVERVTVGSGSGNNLLLACAYKVIFW
jgi:hypothetical protein